MYCINCGKKIGTKGDFCEFCGHKFSNPIKIDRVDPENRSEEVKKSKFSWPAAIVAIIVLIILMQVFDGFIGVSIAGGLAGGVYWLVSSIRSVPIEKGKK